MTTNCHTWMKSQRLGPCKSKYLLGYLSQSTDIKGEADVLLCTTFSLIQEGNSFVSVLSCISAQINGQTRHTHTYDPFQVVLYAGWVTPRCLHYLGIVSVIPSLENLGLFHLKRQRCRRHVPPPQASWFCAITSMDVIYSSSWHWQKHESHQMCVYFFHL